MPLCRRSALEVTKTPTRETHQAFPQLGSIKSNRVGVTRFQREGQLCRATEAHVLLYATATRV